MGCSYDVCNTELDLELCVARTKVLALIQRWTTSGRSKASGSAENSYQGLRLWELEWMQNFQVMNFVKFDITKFEVLLRPVLSLKACYLTLTWRYLVVKQYQYVSVSYLLVPETPTTATIVELRHWFLSLARCETRDNEPVPDLRPRLVWGEIAFRPSAAATIAGPCRISPLPVAAGGTDCPNSGSCHSGTRSGSHGGTGHSCSATADTNHGATRDADIF